MLATVRGGGCVGIGACQARRGRRRLFAAATVLAEDEEAAAGAPTDQLQAPDCNLGHPNGTRNFDIILDHFRTFPRVSQLHPAPHVSCAALNLVPMPSHAVRVLIRCLESDVVTNLGLQAGGAVNGFANEAISLIVPLHKLGLDIRLQVPAQKCFGVFFLMISNRPPCLCSRHAKCALRECVHQEQAVCGGKGLGVCVCVCVCVRVRVCVWGVHLW